MFIPLNVKLSSDCGCSPEAARQCHTARQAGITHLTVTAATTKPQQQLWAATTRQELWHCLGKQHTHPSLCKDQCWLTGQGRWCTRSSSFHAPNSRWHGGTGRGQEYTHISMNQVLQAKPVLPLCSFLVTQVAGLCFTEEQQPQPKMALPSEFPFWMLSRQDGSGHGQVHHSNSSEFLQQKSLLSETYRQSWPQL